MPAGEEICRSGGGGDKGDVVKFRAGCHGLEAGFDLFGNEIEGGLLEKFQGQRRGYSAEFLLISSAMMRTGEDLLSRMPV